MQLPFSITDEMYQFVIQQLASKLILKTKYVWFEMKNIEFDVGAVINAYHAKQRWHDKKKKNHVHHSHVQGSMFFIFRYVHLRMSRILRLEIQ